MNSIPPLIIDLALILTTAGLSLVFCRLLKQPIILGYIVAGFLVSPHNSFWPTVQDTYGISTWAEIGVIFLLFTIGLEFSYKKLATTAKAAVVVASVKVLFVLGLGYFTGRFFQWSQADSLFLGGLLAISSTAIIARSLEDMNLKNTQFANFIVTILIIEDLFAVVLIGLLSTFAITKTISGPELGQMFIQIIFFIILCFVLGLYFIPRLFQAIAAILDDETVVVLSAGACFLMVVVAHNIGFSAALGAFVMGSILSETHLAQKIEKTMMPLKYLFSAIFFVSIGMLINLSLIGKYFWMIVLISLLTIVGKFLGTFLGAILAGKDVRTSVRSGMALSQIGEFSFIIAALGTQFKVTSEFLYPVAIAVSVVTSFLTPYMMRSSGSVHKWIENRIPPHVAETLQSYSIALQDKRMSRNFFSIFWDMYGLKIILNATLIVSIGLLSKFILNEIRLYTDNRFLLEFTIFAITMILALPFFWSILFGKPTQSLRTLEITFEKAKAIHLGIIILRTLIGAILITFIIGQFSSLGAISMLLLVGFSIISIPLSKYAESVYEFFERDFIKNINQASSGTHGNE